MGRCDAPSRSPRASRPFFGGGCRNPDDRRELHRTCGQLDSLMSRAASVNEKSGPYAALLCVGQFCPPADAPAELVEAFRKHVTGGQTRKCRRPLARPRIAAEPPPRLYFSRGQLPWMQPLREPRSEREVRTPLPTYFLASSLFDAEATEVPPASFAHDARMTTRPHIPGNAPSRAEPSDALAVDVPLWAVRCAD